MSCLVLTEASALPKVSPVWDPAEAFLWPPETEKWNPQSDVSVEKVRLKTLDSPVEFSEGLRWNVDIGGSPLLMSAAMAGCGE